MLSVVVYVDDLVSMSLGRGAPTGFSGCGVPANRS